MTKDLVKRDGHRSALPLVRLFKAGAVVEIFLARHLYIEQTIRIKAGLGLIENIRIMKL